MASKTTSWKEKVAPAFDKIIKYFIQFIESASLPTNTGWLRLENEEKQYFERRGKA
jgi:hypothetical protein